MKSFAIAILLFVLLCAGIIINAFYVSSSCEKICDYACLIKEDNHSSALSELEKYWEDHRHCLGFTVSEAKIERMDELIISLSAAVSENNSFEAERICELIKGLSEDIAIYEQVSFYAIF